MSMVFQLLYLLLFVLPLACLYNTQVLELLTCYEHMLAASMGRKLEYRGPILNQELQGYASFQF